MKAFKIKGLREADVLRIHLCGYKGGKYRFATIKKVKQYFLARPFLEIYLKEREGNFQIVYLDYLVRPMDFFTHKGV